MAFNTKAKAKDMSFMFKAKAKDFCFSDVKAKAKDFCAVLKDTSRPRPRPMTNIPGDHISVLILEERT